MPKNQPPPGLRRVHVYSQKLAEIGLDSRSNISSRKKSETWNLEFPRISTVVDGSSPSLVILYLPAKPLPYSETTVTSYSRSWPRSHARCYYISPSLDISCGVLDLIVSLKTSISLFSDPSANLTGHRSTGLWGNAVGRDQPIAPVGASHA